MIKHGLFLGLFKGHLVRCFSPGPHQVKVNHQRVGVFVKLKHFTAQAALLLITIYECNQTYL